jgi:outer membrane protein assembly factor BamB
MKRIVLLAVLLSSHSTLLATDWPHFRGPFFNGSTDEKNLPTEWSPTENIAWSADLPGPSSATPTIWKDRVFVSSTVTDGEKLVALCFDRKTGDQIWSRDIAAGVRRDQRSTFAAPTPTTDGKIVVFLYGNGRLVAFDFAGDKKWERDLFKQFGEFAYGWTYAASPLLYEGKLYVQVLQRDVPVDGRGLKDQVNESYLLAIDPENGKDIWRHIRPSNAKAESREAFTSPVPFVGKTRKELLIVGGDALTGHDLETGKELWRWETWNPERIGHWRHVPSPVASEDVVLVCAPKRDPVYAIKRGGSGVVDASFVAWNTREEKKVTSDVPTPAYYEGDFFIMSDLSKFLSRVTPAGDIVWSVKAPGLAKYEASPLAADGKIYLMNFDGDVVIFNAKDGAVLKEIAMKATKEAPVRSSVVAVDGQIYLRTNRKLYCVGKK